MLQNFPKANVAPTEKWEKAMGDKELARRASEVYNDLATAVKYLRHVGMEDVANHLSSICVDLFDYDILNLGINNGGVQTVYKNQTNKEKEWTKTT